ncbi:hypothetical protein ONS96_007073 [Cadophora gregata f. sp. sojae]|nr:hypothetical protein ONS96_007073 [Cadophora gregata f. sp. sojae]
MSFFSATGVRDGMFGAVVTDGRGQNGALVAVATHSESRDGTPVTRVDTVYGGLVTGRDGSRTLGNKVATFIENPIPYVDPRDGRRYNIPGVVRMANYYAGNFSYDDHNLGLLRQVHPRLALEDERRANERGRAFRHDRTSRPAPVRRSRSRDLYTVSTSHTSRQTNRPTSSSAVKPKALLVPIPVKLKNNKPPLWDDSAHNAWSCVNWEDFAMEAAEKERETLRDSIERPWAHEQ